MKKLLVVGIAAIALSACGRVETVLNKLEGYAGMLERKVTLYDASGEEIKSWVTNNEIQYQGPAAAFIDKNGTNVRISGTFIIEGR